MMPVTVALSSVLALLGVPLLAATARRSSVATHLVYGASLVICLVALAVALSTLVNGANATSSLRLDLGLPWIGAHFRMDALAAFFLAVANLGGAAASLFAIGYGQHEKAPGRVLPFYPAFLAGMNLVILADDAFTFLVAWEFMSLSSWALVMAHHRDPDNRRAGYIYIVMASFGTLSLLLAFGLLAGGAGGYAFAEIRGSPAALPGLVLVLALIGAGSKAGLVPLHVWLPLAHPAAPSHVSALMSGVMTKVAVYGFIRIVFDLIGPPNWWWGVAVIPVAGITCVLGVLSALMQHDLKRLLAYHTVENIGIIFIGLGLALAFSAHNMPAAAALALHSRAVARLQSLPVQEPAVLRRRGRAGCDGRARHGAARRPDPSHAAYRVHLPHRLHGHLGAAAAQRLRFRVADLSGHPAEPRTVRIVGPQADRARGRRHARPVGGACRGLLRQGIRHDFPRPAADAGGAASAGDRPRFARRHVRFCCSVPGGRHSSGLRHRWRWRPSRKAWSAAACPRKPPSRGCRSCRSPRAAAPITASWSSSSSPSPR